MLQIGILAQIHYNHADKSNFLQFCQNVQNDLKVKVNDLHFQYHLTVSRDACLVQIW